jgi:hypothetical protein
MRQGGDEGRATFGIVRDVQLASPTTAAAEVLIAAWQTGKG